MSFPRSLLPLALALALLAGCGKQAAPEPTPTPTPSPTAAPTPEPTPTPEIVLAMATASANATKDAPEVTDPATWDEAGKALMEQLEQQFAADGMTLDAQEGFPYLLAVNRAASTVTVYAADAANRDIDRLADLPHHADRDGVQQGAGEAAGRPADL